MPRPLSRRPSAAAVQRPEQNKYKSPFYSQLGQDESDQSSSVIEDTQTRPSGRRHITASRSDEAVTSTPALPSHQSEERPEQAKSRRQTQSGHSSSIPQASGSNSRTPQGDVEAKRVAKERPEQAKSRRQTQPSHSSSIPQASGSNSRTQGEVEAKRAAKEQPEQAKSRRQTQSSHSSSIPQAIGSNSQTPQGEVEAKRAAAEHSPALDDVPPPELLAAARDFLEPFLEEWTKNKGLPPEVVQKGVVQAATSWFSQLRRDQSEPIQSQQSTTGLNVRTTTRHSDPGSQHGSKSSRDAAGDVPVVREGTSSRLVTPGGENVAEQVAALPVNKKRRSTAPGLKLKSLPKATVNNEQAFCEEFEKLGLVVIQAGHFDINLFEFARETAEDVKPKFRDRLRDVEEQEPQRRRGQTRPQSTRENQTKLVDSTEEVWQVLFTIIANMFVFGLWPLYHTVKAASGKSSKCPKAAGQSLPGGPSATDTTTDSSERGRRNVGESNNEVGGLMSGDMLSGFLDKGKLEELKRSVRWWWKKEDKSQKQLKKVYDYYKKLQTVRLYDAMLESWKENEGSIQAFLGERGYESLDAATFILGYIWQQTPTLREKDTDDTLTKRSEESKDMILGFRPICSLVEAFGEGVLLLLVDDAEKYVPGKVGEGQEKYPQHERIRDVALSLCKVDREKHDGQLREQFTGLEEKVLRPALQLREDGNTGSLLLDCPKRDIFEGIDVGKRISCLLVRISESNTHKRRRSDSNMEQAAEGDPRTSKKNKTKPNEDGEHGGDGSESGTARDPEGEDLYNP